MRDLQFMIVNSNLQHAQNLIHELQSRVSFDVYQDTKEKNIWDLMEGGKDDLYVYDRCGRLAYYIPYPLSIMSGEESSLVTSAILATYYRSPCGTTCEKNSTTLRDFLNNIDTTESPVEVSTQEISTTVTELNQFIVASNQSEDISDLLQVNVSSILESVETTGNSSEIFSDFDYPDYDEAVEEHGHNETNPKYDHSFFNTLYNMFFFTASTKQPPIQTNLTISNKIHTTNTSTFEVLEDNEINGPMNLSDNVIEPQTNNTEFPTDLETQTPKSKIDRCAEADPSVCKDWSKKRLLRAHNCCSLIEDRSSHQPRFCSNFGKKRCKKIRTILKCCIKTALFEVTTEAAVTTVPIDVSEDEVATVTTDGITDKAKTDVVCCRQVDGGKLCRVAERPMCEDGEYQEKTPLLGRTM